MHVDAHRSRPLFGRLLPLATVVLVLAFPATARAQINPGRLTGTVVDEAGNPVGEITLLFTPDDPGSPNAPRKLKVNKKGKFSHSFFPADTYKVELVDDDEHFLKSMDYQLLDDARLEIDSNRAEAHPTKGLPAISVRPNRQVVLSLVVAPRQVQEQLAMEVAVSEARGPLKKMSDLYAAGKMDQVVAEGDALLAETPDLGPALYLRGVAHWKLGQLEQAEADLVRAIELVPDQEGIHGVLASVLLESGDALAASGDASGAKGRYLEAAEQFAKNLEAAPGSLPSLLSRAAALEKAGDEDALDDALEAVIEADPDQLPAYFRLSTLYSARGETDRALAVLDRIPAKDASAAAAIFNVAVRLYNDDDLAGAEAAAKKASEVDPELAPAHRLLGLIYLSQNRRDDATREMERFLELAPNDPEADDARRLLEALRSQGG